MMELNSENIARLLYPVAAFESSSTALIDASYKAAFAQPKPTTWAASTLNPKNRIDSLAEPLNAKWRVDGSAGMGTQFYTVPISLRHHIPMRIDTFIPERKEIPVNLQAVLDISSAFYTRDGRVAQLGIARYIVRVLDRWSGHIPDFEAFYNNLPFGSRIVLQNIEADIRSVRIQILQTHFLERQLLSVGSLQSMWKLPSDSWPETTDISNVTLVQQLHDSVSLVSHAGQARVMKSLTSSPKYLYHELKVLLTMSPHPNIISKPSHLIVKQCNFGNKLAVVGFILDYYSAGTLRDALSFRRINHSLRLRDQVEWSIQLTDALIHIRDEKIMYCDLRLDNIVLASKSDKIVMIDFEARGVGTLMSAPEITYLEYIHSLANESNNNLGGMELDRFKRLHEGAISGHSVPTSTEMYRNPRHGYCVSWLCLSEKEREAAQIYMLGKVLWGIFEGVGSPEKGLLVEHLREDMLEYPEWRNTPEAIRKLINACCISWRRYEKFPLARKGQLLGLRNTDGTETVDQVRDAAARWWKAELQDAKEFVEQRIGDSSRVWHIFSARPTLEDVLFVLKSFRESMRP
jgi:serine/threonine protein kinase